MVLEIRRDGDAAFLHEISQLFGVGRWAGATTARLHLPILALASTCRFDEFSSFTTSIKGRRRKDVINNRTYQI